MSRELLELAAKAVHGKFSNQMLESGWNPLEDDGDCARMECALELGINIGDISVTVTGKGGVYVDEYYKHHNGDKNKARRYASTRLAAEIGKDMT